MNTTSRLLEDLESMMRVPALSGHEEPMIRLMEDSLGRIADSVSTDCLGNVRARIAGTDGEAPRVMLFAHMDQLGMIVRRIDPDGCVRMERLGGIPEKVLPGCRMSVKTLSGDTVPAVVGIKSHHATPQEEKSRVVPYAELHLDLGCDSAEAVRALGVEVGCPVAYEPYFARWGSRIVGTSVDNRGGCAVLLEAARRLKARSPRCEVHVVATVQEEFNLRGALVAAQDIEPDIAIALDVMVAGDTPDLRGKNDIALGGGPILGMYSFHGRGTLNGVLPHPLLVSSFRESAGRLGMPLQYNAATGLLTDLSYVQLVGGRGVAALDLGFPARYTHSPVEMCDLRDLEALARLLEETVAGWGPMDLRR